jgi:hypothetical protein
MATLFYHANIIAAYFLLKYTLFSRFLNQIFQGVVFKNTLNETP